MTIRDLHVHRLSVVLFIFPSPLGLRDLHPSWEQSSAQPAAVAWGMSQPLFLMYRLNKTVRSAVLIPVFVVVFFFFSFFFFFFERIPFSDDLEQKRQNKQINKSPIETYMYWHALLTNKYMIKGASKQTSNGGVEATDERTIRFVNKQ